MDSFMSFKSYDIEEEKHLYCSAPQSVEDIIWAGSDDEQSIEEIESKRRRYEYHARRYLRGHMPVLQSAGLRGPFEKDWVNPWRYRERKAPNWWQPGSKDMLFTRANVMKRAADHGKGHLNPGEALAWCKTEAQVEARRKLEAQQISEQRAKSEEETHTGPGMDRQEDLASLGDAQQEGNGNERAKPNTSLSQVLEEQCFLMEMQQGTVSLYDRQEGNGLKDTKRHADSKLLKGSHISKRAKLQASPTNSSPTPTPGCHVEKRPKQRRCSKRSPVLSDGMASPVLNPRTPWLQANRELTYQPSNNTSAITSHLETKQSAGEIAEDISPAYSRSPEHNGCLGDIDTMSRHQQHRENLSIGDNPGSHSPDSEDHESQDTTFLSEMSDFEMRHLPHSQSDFREPSSSAFNPGNVSKHPIAQIVTVGKRKIQSRRSCPSNTPILPRRSGVLVDYNTESSEDLSFITEIVPSSRDLEHFQYRKKKRYSNRKRSDDATRISHGQIKLVSRSTSRSFLDEIDLSHNRIEEQLGNNPGSPSPDSDKINFRPTPSEGEALSLREQSPTSESHSSGLPAPTMEVCLDYNVIQAEQDGSPQDGLVDSSCDMMHNFHDPNHDAANHIAREEEILKDSHPAGYILAEEFLAQVGQASFKPESRCPQNVEFVASRLGDSAPSKINVTGEPAIQVVTEPIERLDTVEDSTQSYITTTVLSFQSTYNQSKPSTKASQSPRERVVVEESSNTMFTGELRGGAGNTASFSLEHLRVGDPHNKINSKTIDGLISDHLETSDPMQAIQQALSQDCRGSAGSSNQDDAQDDVSSPCIISNEQAQNIKTPIPVKAVNPEPSDEEDHAVWQKEDLQSPWGPVNISLISNHAQIEPQGNKAFGDIGLDNIAENINSQQSMSEYNADWQRLKPPETPPADEIKSFRDFILRTPLPEPMVSKPIEGDLPSTQLLVDAATNNPWTSAFRDPTSGKAKKRVSFGILPSEEDETSHPHGSNTSNHSSSSPLPPAAVKRLNDKDIFNNEATSMDQFEKYLAATSGVNGEFSRKSYPSLHSSSPAVGAMAEAFMAADQETSTEHEYCHIPDETPTRHLKPSSKARTNVTLSEFGGQSTTNAYHIDQEEGFAAIVSKTTDYDMGDAFDAYLGDAGVFLEEWSVEAELRKVNSARQSHGRSDHSRSLFEIASDW